MSSLERKVIDHFEETKDQYSRMDSSDNIFDHSIIDFILKNVSSEERIKIVEIGGGSGYLLKQLEGLLSHYSLDLINLELSFGIYSRQMADSTQLIGGDVKNSPFKDNTFNFIVLKNVLHHLVGESRKESKELVVSCIDELFRIVVDQGYVIILEQYNGVRFFSSVLFYITLLFARFGLTARYFGLNKDIVVSFLTPEEIMEVFIRRRDSVEVLLKEERKRRMPTTVRFKLTLLQANIGHVFYVFKITKNSHKS